MVLQLLNTQISIIAILLFIAGLMFSIGFHEFSHAISAYLLGDKTPKYDGRLTLNPLAHMDPIGMLMILFGPIGWGKPVIVNPYNMGDQPEKKYLLTSIAGPISNIVLAIAFFGIVVLYKSIASNITLLSAHELESIYFVLKSLFIVNVGLAIFNLVPIPPLDGSKIWGVVLPYDKRMVYETFLNKYSFILFIALILPILPNGQSIIGIVIEPLLNFISNNTIGNI
jgi:Zn-dependent protease